MKLYIIFSLICIAGTVVVVTTQLMLFVVQPIGAIPEGRTLIAWRLDTMNLIDSADSWCMRQIGSVNLLCRGAVLAKMANEDVIIVRLPYSEFLYLWSTDGIMCSR